MKINLFAPVTAAADKAEADQGSIEITNGFVDMVSGQPTIKTRPGLREVHATRSGTRTSLYWWEAKRMLIIATGDRIYAKPSKKGALVDITPDNADDRFSAGVRVFFSADEYGVTMSVGLFMLWWGGNLTKKAQRITDNSAPFAITSLTYLKGYTIASILNTQLFAYAVYGPTDPRTSPPPWSPLYQSASASPDDILCLSAGWEELFVLGRESAQSHYASGDSIVPFPPLNGSVVETGIMNSEVLQKLGNSWLFYTPHKQVVQVQGRTPTIISKPVEKLLRKLTYFDKVHSFTLFNRFYVLNFYSDNKTLVYDIETGLWYQWNDWNETYTTYERFRGCSAAHAKAWGQQFIGDFEGNLYEMSYEVTHDNLQPIRMRVRSAYLDHGTSGRKFSTDLSVRLRRGETATTIYEENPKRNFEETWTVTKDLGQVIFGIFHASNGYTYVTGTTKIWRTLDMVNFEECTLVGTVLGSFGTLSEASGKRIVTNDYRAIWVSTDGLTFTRTTLENPANAWGVAYAAFANPGEPFVYSLRTYYHGQYYYIRVYNLDTMTMVADNPVIQPTPATPVNDTSTCKSIDGSTGLMVVDYGGAGVSNPGYVVLCRCSGGEVGFQTRVNGTATSRVAIVVQRDKLVRVALPMINADTIYRYMYILVSRDMCKSWSEPSPGELYLENNSHARISGGISLNDDESMVIGWNYPGNSLYITDTEGNLLSSTFSGVYGVGEPKEFTRVGGTVYVAMADNNLGRIMQLGSTARELIPNTPNFPRKLLIRWRNDGKSAWSNYRELNLGETGDYEIVRRIQGLGQYRSRQYEIVSYTAVPITLTGAEENVTTANP